MVILYLSILARKLVNQTPDIMKEIVKKVGIAFSLYIGTYLLGLCVGIIDVIKSVLSVDNCCFEITYGTSI